MKKSIYSLLIGAAILASCGKTSPDPVIPVEEDPDDDTTIGVTTSGQATAGNEQVFAFTGDINKAEFYSGEPGHVYEYRDRTEKELEGEVNVSFIARVMNSYEFDPHELDAFISTDFSGEHTYQAVSAATWQSFTDRITFPTNNADGPDNDGRVENKVDIADLMEQGKPFYVGFRYICPPRPPAPRNSRQWRVGFYSLTHEFSGESVSLDHYESAVWNFVAEGDIEAGREPSQVTVDGNAVNFLGNNQSSTYDGFQTWAISTAYDIYTVEPDEGITIESPSAQYGYVYAVPGTYEATFVLHSPDSAEPVVKKVEVTVAP